MTSFKKLFFVGVCIAPLVIVLHWGIHKLMEPAITLGQAEQQLLLEEMNFTTKHAKHTLPSLPFILEHDGQAHKKTLADFLGKPTLVHIWATWCGACLREYSGFDQFVKKHKKRFNIISLNVDLDEHKADAINTVRTFLKDHKFTSLPTIYDHTAQLTRTFTIAGTPCTIVINAKGQEIGRFNGAVLWDDPEFIYTLNALIDKEDQGE